MRPPVDRGYGSKTEAAEGIGALIGVMLYAGKKQHVGRPKAFIPLGAALLVRVVRPSIIPRIRRTNWLMRTPRQSFFTPKSSRALTAETLSRHQYRALRHGKARYGLPSDPSEGGEDKRIQTIVSFDSFPPVSICANFSSRPLV
jgi:hypothetical protein